MLRELRELTVCAMGLRHLKIKLGAGSFQSGCCDLSNNRDISCHKYEIESMELYKKFLIHHLDFSSLWIENVLFY